MKILALSGKRGSGKSTIAEFLADEYGAIRLSFAMAIRNDLAAIGCDRQTLNMKPTPIPARNLLVAYGQFRRWCNPDHWVSPLLGEMTSLRQNGVDLVVVDDLRFWNEAEALETYGAILVRVWIDDPKHMPEFIPGVDDDRSETDLDQWQDWSHVIGAEYGDIVTLQYTAAQIVRGVTDGGQK